MTDGWSGGWVADHLGLTIESPEPAVYDLVGVAIRQNPRRPHLLVSSVLGKHVPTDPRIVYGTGRRLGDLVAGRLDGDAVVLGYAETATGLGHAVAEAARADYLHSTRRQVPGVVSVGGFEEEHSHATSHLLLPEDPAMLARPGTLVLVDDELSTGRTALNTIGALHARYPRDRYLVAALVDLREDDDRARTARVEAQLGVRIDVIALATGRVRMPADFPARAAEVIAAQADAHPPDTGSAPIVRCGGWPAGIRDGGRHGFGSADSVSAHSAARACASDLAGRITGERTLVLGFEELMYAPLLVACALADELGPVRPVRFSSTTRSPVLAIDAPGYPIRTQLTFRSHDDPSDGPGDRYAYNVGPHAGAKAFSDIVLVIDDVADTDDLAAGDGLLARLRAVCGQVHLLVLPSYRPARVLSDAS
jgi:hypothetical protein